MKVFYESDIVSQRGCAITIFIPKGGINTALLKKAKRQIRKERDVLYFGSTETLIDKTDNLEFVEIPEGEEKL